MRAETRELAFDMPAEEACRLLAASPRALGEMVRDGLVTARLRVRFGRAPRFAEIRVMGSQVRRLAGSNESAGYRERFPLREISTSRALGLGAVLSTLGL